MFKILGFIVSILLYALPASAKIKIEKHQLPTINYVNIPVQTPEISWVVSAKLSIPRTDNT
jgi:hypothetical protein